MFEETTKKKCAQCVITIHGEVNLEGEGLFLKKNYIKNFLT